MHISIGSLNVRQLAKVGDPDKQFLFIRHLRFQSLDLLALQDTSLPDSSFEERMHLEFQAQDSLWSPFCGLLCFNNNVILEPFLTFRDGRGLWAKVTHTNHDFDPFHLLVLYAPADRSTRFTFLTSTVLPILSDPSLSSILAQTLIVGDFNYSYARRDSAYLSAPLEWRDFLQEHFVNVMMPMDTTPDLIPTFHSNTGSSTIDYISVPPAMASLCSIPQVLFVNPEWTDHSLLTFFIRCPRVSAGGRGLWKANPMFADSPGFQAKLSQNLTDAYDRLVAVSSPQEAWDYVKCIVQDTCRQHGRYRAAWRKRQEKHLQRLRNKTMRDMKKTKIVPYRLASISSQIAQLQQEQAYIQSLRAEVRCQEQGETLPVT